LSKLLTYIKSLRKFRKLHRFTGTFLAALVLVSAVTGILLALKKEVAVIQPPTAKGISKDLMEWKSIAQLSELATAALYQNHPEEKGNPIDRLDVRPSKGVVKLLFENRQWEVQLDAASGEVKSIARRHSDWIEALHDGSIISEGFKLISMNVLGFGLLFLMVTGLWLWYGPRRIRSIKKEKRKQYLKEKSSPYSQK